MSSATETALVALFEKIKTLADLPGAVVPVCLRNEDLAARLEEIGDEVFAYLNLWDGAQQEREEYLGAGNGVDNGYGISHDARLEWIVAGGESAAREAAFDAGMIAICDAIAADRTLGDLVDFVELGTIEGAGSGLVTDGVANAKGVVITIGLTFRSSRPF